jgi:flap endonuclease-1
MGKPDSEKLINFLCDENDFSEDRVVKAADRLKAASGARQQTLDQWF